MVYNLNPINLHINGQFLLQNQKKKNIFGVFLGIINKMRFFSKNSAPSVFYQ